MPNVLMPSHEPVTVADLAPLLRMSAIEVPERDLEPLAKALERYLADTRILLQADLAGHAPAFGARWHV